MLLFGVFLAWKTRNVKIDILNDSKKLNRDLFDMILVVVVMKLLLSFQNLRT